MSDIPRLGLTFDDVLIVPAASEVLPRDTDVSTRLTQDIKLKIPILSAPMDTVTECLMAIAMAREGGLGIIQRNLPIEKQAEQVEIVKKAENWIIRNPVQITPTDTIQTAKELMEKFNVTGLPVTENGKLKGLVTIRDLKFEKNLSQIVEEIMVKDIITADEHIRMEEAKKILHENRIEKLPIVDKKGFLKGLITIKDIENKEKFPNSSLDENGQLMVGAAIGPNDIERVKALTDANVDILVMDTAHGHSRMVVDSVRKLKQMFDVPIIAGNVATKEATEDLIAAGADSVKVGVGPGSICSARVITGVGVPQITAVQDCAEAAKEYDIPIIADGGIRYSGDIAKAIVAGASSVMLGNLLAGTDEAPGRIIFMNGRNYKKYRGMGSVSAMERGGNTRYFREPKKKSKYIPEGVEGVVPCKGKVSEVLYQLIGGLKSSMGYAGAKTITDMQKSKFVRVTKAGIRESHPHDIYITEESPNYNPNRF